MARFNGKAEDFNEWRILFRAQMKLRKLGYLTDKLDPPVVANNDAPSALARKTDLDMLFQHVILAVDSGTRAMLLTSGVRRTMAVRCGSNYWKR